MNFNDAKNEILQVFSKTERQHLPKLLEWLKTSDDLDDFLVDNQSVILQSIAEDLRVCLPLEAMAPSESMAIQKTQQKPHPTVHVDAFLYDEEAVDSLCEEGKMSRNYCLNCGSHRTAPLEFISHSFSIPELQFLFHNVLPDLSGKLVVDVGSRLGAVLFGLFTSQDAQSCLDYLGIVMFLSAVWTLILTAPIHCRGSIGIKLQPFSHQSRSVANTLHQGYLYSAASQLVGVEISSEFVKLQTMAVEKYGFSDRIQVIHADIRSQSALVQNTNVLIMNNVFEYFMEPSDQMQAWLFISQNFRKKDALLVTVPSVKETLALLQDAVFLETLALSQWIEEVPLDYTVYLKNDTDPDSLKQIHLYRVL